MSEYTLYLENEFLVDVEQAIEDAIANGDMPPVKYGYNLESPHHGEFSVTVDMRSKAALDAAVIAAGIHRVDIVCNNTTEHWRDDIQKGAGKIVEYLLVLSQEPTHLASYETSYFGRHLGWDTTKHLGSEGEKGEQFVMVKESSYMHTDFCKESSDRGECRCPGGQPQEVVTKSKESLYDTINVGFGETDQRGDYYGKGILNSPSIPVFFRPEDDDLNDDGYLNSNAPWFWNIAEEFGGGSFDSEGLMKRSGYTFEEEV